MSLSAGMEHRARVVGTAECRTRLGIGACHHAAGLATHLAVAAVVAALAPRADLSRLTGIVYLAAVLGVVRDALRFVRIEVIADGACRGYAFPVIARAVAPSRDGVASVVVLATVREGIGFAVVVVVMLSSGAFGDVEATNPRFLDSVEFVLACGRKALPLLAFSVGPSVVAATVVVVMSAILHGIGFAFAPIDVRTVAAVQVFGVADALFEFVGVVACAGHASCRGTCAVRPSGQIGAAVCVHAAVVERVGLATVAVVMFVGIAHKRFGQTHAVHQFVSLYAVTRDTQRVFACAVGPSRQAFAREVVHSAVCLRIVLAFVFPDVLAFGASDDSRSTSAVDVLVILLAFRGDASGVLAASVLPSIESGARKTVHAAVGKGIVLASGIVNVSAGTLELRLTDALLEVVSVEAVRNDAFSVDAGAVLPPGDMAAVVVVAPAQCDGILFALCSVDVFVGIAFDDAEAPSLGGDEHEAFVARGDEADVSRGCVAAFAVSPARVVVAAVVTVLSAVVDRIVFAGTHVLVFVVLASRDGASADVVFLVTEEVFGASPDAHGVVESMTRGVLRVFDVLQGTRGSGHDDVVRPPVAVLTVFAEFDTLAKGASRQREGAQSDEEYGLCVAISVHGVIPSWVAMRRIVCGHEENKENG